MPLNEFLRGWFTAGPSPRVPYVRGWKEAAHKFGLGSAAQMRVLRGGLLIALQSSLGTILSSRGFHYFLNARERRTFKGSSDRFLSHSSFLSPFSSRIL